MHASVRVVLAMPLAGTQHGMTMASSFDHARADAVLGHGPGDDDRWDPIRSLSRVVDHGDVREALALLPSEGDPLIRALLLSCRDFQDGRLQQAASSARDVLLALASGTERPMPVTEVASEHLTRVAIVLGDAALLAETRRLIGEFPSIRSGDRHDPHDVATDLVAEIGRLDAIVAARASLPSYRRGAAAARLAAILVARDEPARALPIADLARDDLAATGSPRERALVELTAAGALVALGRQDEASARTTHLEHDAFTDPFVARALADYLDWHAEPGAAARVRRDMAMMAMGTPDESTGDDWRDVPLDPVAILRRTARSAVPAVATGAPEAVPLVHSLLVLATRSGATLWVALGRILAGLRNGTSLEGTDETPSSESFPPHALALSMVAPAVVARLGSLDDQSRAIVQSAVAERPWRWRPFLRRAIVGAPDRTVGLLAAQLLAVVGERGDVALIDGLGRMPLPGPAHAAMRSDPASLAKALARRVAPRILVEDLGRVGVVTDEGPLPSISRRKVLGLVCFLATQPEMAATREQVLDALWPDADPEIAANSLNQTVYFLRRSLEPGYLERRSPDYVHHDAEIVWLDSELVAARSRRCRDLVSAARSGSATAVDDLIATYTGRFALDFSYDGWAEAHREALHASYLATIETAIGSAVAREDFARAIMLAQRTLEVDSAAEGIELALLRLYRRTGAHAAAAEQYAHYAAVMRDELGVEPPALDSL